MKVLDSDPYFFKIQVLRNPKQEKFSLILLRYFSWILLDFLLFKFLPLVLLIILKELQS